MAMPAPGDVGRTESVGTGELAVTLAHYSQCGGNGGNCRNAGGESACGDMPFAGYTCENNLMCVRQNRWFWQVGCNPDLLPVCVLLSCQQVWFQDVVSCQTD